MGKKNTPKTANDGFTAPNKAKTAKAPKGKTGLILISTVLIFAICIGAIIYGNIADSGFFYRNTVSISSANYEVNNAMLQYFFNTQYQEMAESLQSWGVNTQKNLKDQKYTSSKTWYDYLMQDVTIPQVKQILVLCEAAKAAGFELTEDDRKELDGALEGLKSTVSAYASLYNVSETYYLQSIYGYGINYDDIRSAMELNHLAAAYAESVAEAFEYADADLAAYLEEHHSDFLVLDYTYFVFETPKTEETTEGTTTASGTTAEADSTETEAADATEGTTAATEGTTAATEGTTAATEATEGTDVAASASNGTDTTAGTTAEATGTGTDKDDKEEEEELSAEQQATKDLAYKVYNELLAAANGDVALEILDKAANDYLTTVIYPELGEDASEEDKKKREDSIAEAIDTMDVEAAANDESSEFLKFAFGEERKDRAYIEANDKNGTYGVYLITSDAYIEEYATRDVAIITMSASSGEDIDARLESFKTDFEASDKSLDTFKEMALSYSHDSSVSENRGVYENQGKGGEMGVEALEEWLFDEARTTETPDYTIITEGEDKEKMIYIAYYIGEGQLKWERDVEDTMRAEDYNEQYQEYEKTYAVEYDLTEAYKIPAQAGIA